MSQTQKIHQRNVFIKLCHYVFVNHLIFDPLIHKEQFTIFVCLFVGWLVDWFVILISSVLFSLYLIECVTFYWCIGGRVLNERHIQKSINGICVIYLVFLFFFLIFWVKIKILRSNEIMGLESLLALVRN